MLTLYALALLAAGLSVGLLVLRAVGPKSYKELFDKYLWTTGEGEN